MLKYLAVLLVLAGPALAENAKDRGSPSPGGHAGAKHEPAKKAEAAKLDGIYSQEVGAWNDFQATGRIGAYNEAFDANDNYISAVTNALNDKTVSKNYHYKEPVSDFGQCCPYDDADNDGYADGSAGDPTGPDGNLGGIP